MSKNPSSVHRDLAWLPVSPSTRPTFSAADFEDGRSLRRATSRRLTEDDLWRLVKARDQQESIPFAAAIHLTVLSNANFDLLAKTIRGAGLRYALDLEVQVEPMGVIGAWALSEDENMFVREYDGRYVLIALTAHYFIQPNLVGDSGSAGVFIERLVAELHAVRGKALARGVSLLVQSVPLPASNLLGSLDAEVPGTPLNLILCFNRRVKQSGVGIVDICDLSNHIGHANWSSDHYWNWAKLPFHPDNNVAYADKLSRSLVTVRGGGAKCLVLDLDNTLWKGVIGDDGLNGIEVGNNSPDGEAHLAIQRFALSLMRCGVVLAVCSKNDVEVALLPFTSHADMLLRRDDITTFVANWEDKPTNLQSISRTLNLGLDSFVFIDDNPMERDLVRQELPEVLVPELPDTSPSQWIQIICAAGYFDVSSFTETDKDRSAQYRANSAREKIKQESRDLTSYLRDLSMDLFVGGFTEDVSSRVVQLIGRSNQFNLTTRRYMHDNVRRFRDDPLVLDLAFRLKDRFGDNGIIAVLIGQKSEDEILIDTWLMSCRVLKRGVEEACLSCLCRSAIEMGATRIVGEYIPTGKNSMVADLYPRLGFKPMDQAVTASLSVQRWSLDLREFVEPPLVMEVHHTVGL